jgi:malate dehydrogenase (oxaloacetate-decarboxylating)
MCIEAAKALAEFAEKTRGISEDALLPTMDDWEVFPYEAAAVGIKAIEQGIAKIKYTREELLNLARKTIRHARDEIDLLMREGLIPPAPAE